MRHFALRCVVCAGFVAGSCNAFSQISPSNGGYLFRAKFAPGSKSLYTVTALGGPKDMIVGVTLPITEKVLSVKKGLATIQVILGKSRVTRNGKVVQLGAGNTAQAESVQLDALNESPGKDSESRQTHVAFVTQPVKVGASWTTVAYVPFAQGVQKVSATYTLAGFESINGRRAARLTTHYNGNHGASIKGAGVMWVSAADGSVVKGNMSLVITLGANSIPVTVRISHT